MSRIGLKFMIVTFMIGALSLAVNQRLFGEARTYDKVQYFKQQSNSQAEKKGEEIEGKLNFDSSAKVITFSSRDKAQVSVPYDKIKTLLYERTSRPRYISGILIAWPLLFTKGKKHFLTIQYTDEKGQGQYAIFRLDKKNYRAILATSEADTGKKVERAEEH